MKVRRESCRLVKPSYDEGGDPHDRPITRLPLTVFDTITFNAHIAVIYAYRHPTPSNSHLERALARALAEYSVFAGRLQDPDANGRPRAILLNDAGALFVEASVDRTLQESLPLVQPSPVLLSLHPNLHGAEALAQVQLTRFSCGSLVVGFTAHHMVADGHSTSAFLVAWGKATRGVPIDPLSLPLHSRSTFFPPRDPPRIEFEHRAVEFTCTTKEPKKKKDVPMVQLLNCGGAPEGAQGEDEGKAAKHVIGVQEEILVHKANFTVDFLDKLKVSASSPAQGGTTCNGVAAAIAVNGIRPFSTFECLLAHLWRAITRARGLVGQEFTQVRISVNGRARLRPPVPAEYFGNLVLWAFPRAKVQELVQKPLGYAAGLIRDAASLVNDAYIRSFVDFANSGVVEEEGLVPTADMAKQALCPNLEVDSWMRLPFHELDFGGGGPFMFMPTYFPVEGMLFLVPSCTGDGSIDAYVPLFRRNLPTFMKLCYVLDLPLGTCA